MRMKNIGHSGYLFEIFPFAGLPDSPAVGWTTMQSRFRLFGVAGATSLVDGRTDESFGHGNY